MPFYKSANLKRTTLSHHSPGEYQAIAGELMKAGVVTFRQGTGSRPHWHEKEEQLIYALEGRRYFLVGEEEQIIEPGDIVHIPRGVLHAGRTLGEKAVMYVVKSPAGGGGLGEDIHYPPDAAEIAARLDAMAEKLAGEA
jgi:quercetin dioxygenase-like cupin family protein